MITVHTTASDGRSVGTGECLVLGVAPLPQRALDHDPVLGSAFAALLLARLDLLVVRTAALPLTAWTGMAGGGTTVTRRPGTGAVPTARARAFRPDDVFHVHRLHRPHHVSRIIYRLSLNCFKSILDRHRRNQIPPHIQHFAIR